MKGISTFSHQQHYQTHDGKSLILPLTLNLDSGWEILTILNNTCSRYMMGIPYFSQQHLIKVYDGYPLLFPTAPDEGTCWEILTFPNST